MLTLAVVTGSSERELVSVYGGGDDEPVLLAHDDAWVPQEDFGSYFHVQVLTEGPYTVLIEPNGWTGSLPEIARRASSEGRFVSAHWSMSGTRRITEAQGGKVTAWFNPFLIAEPGGVGDLVPDWAEEVAFDIERPNASTLAAVELRTRLVLERSWFTELFSTFRIPDPDTFLRGVADVRTP